MPAGRGRPRPAVFLGRARRRPLADGARPGCGREAPRLGEGTGITVNCVLPGTIDTPANRRSSPDADFSHWVAPAAIAEVILFLASPAARAIHAAAVPVYGLS